MLTGDTAFAKEALVAGVLLAQEAVKKSGSEAFVALNIGPLGKMLKPLGDVSASRVFRCLQIYWRICVVGASLPNEKLSRKSTES